MTSVWRLGHVTSLTTPLQLSVFISEWNAYFTTSNQFAVEKTSNALYFPHLILFFSQKYVTIQKTKRVKNGRKHPVHTDFKRVVNQLSSKAWSCLWGALQHVQALFCFFIALFFTYLTFILHRCFRSLKNGLLALLCVPRGRVYVNVRVHEESCCSP